MALPTFSGFPPTLERFVQHAPMAVITRLLLQSQLSSDYLNGVFQDHAQKQYTHRVTFATIASLLGQVVMGRQPSVHAAYLWERERDQIAVSLTAVYEKLAHTEPVVCEALVQDSAARLRTVLTALPALRDEPVEGYRLRTVDGNHLGPRDHRLGPLRGSTRAALPGQALLLHDYATQTISALVSCEDAHAHERSYLPRLLERVQPGDCLLGDRAFSTLEFLSELDQQGAGYLIRRHATMPYTTTGKRHYRGRCGTGRVYEQTVRIKHQNRIHHARAVIIVRRKPLQPTRKSPTVDRQPQQKHYRVILLTNLPASRLTAVRAAHLYRQRWQIEEAFRRLTQVLNCDVKTLGYPKAALLALSLTVLAYNTLMCVQGSLAAVYGVTQVDQQVSFYHIANEIRIAYAGMDIAIGAEDWKSFELMPTDALAKVLRQIAHRTKLARYPKKKRGPRKAVRRRRLASHHTSIARILQGVLR
jgi:hypothetical protein